MDLREYADVIRRRWLIIVAVTVLSAIVAGAWAWRGPRAFEATTRMTVSVAPKSGPGEVAPYEHFREYYAWLSSEYLADDLSEIIRSDAFAEDIRLALNEDVDRSAIRDVVRARKTHRILEVTVFASSADRARRIGMAVGDVIQTKGSKYLAQLAEPSAQVVVIDEPVVKAATTTGSQLADIGLRTLLGLMAGLFLAFVVDYLDSTLRTRNEVEQALGLPVLGEIPSGA
jgi:capsular polysaccharide biosynthesis protein